MPNVGDTISIGGGIVSGVAPGQSQYKTGAGATKIIGTQNVNGQTYYNIDQSGIGGGTGWVLGSALGGAAASPAGTPAPSANSPAPAFTDTQGVTDYLGNIQDSIHNTPNGVQNVSDILAQVKASLPQNRPAVPNLTQTYTDLRTTYGLDTLDQQIKDTQAQLDAINGQFYTQQLDESGKPVAQNVIEGRIGQEQKQAILKSQPLQDQLKTLTNLYTSKLNIVQTLAQLTNTDYQNASSDYNNQYSQAISTIQLASGIQKDQFSESQQLQDNARADLQIYTNAIVNGNLSLDSLSPTQQVQINKLEVQAGLPVGFVSSLKIDPKANIVSTTSNNGQIQVLVRNPDGSLKLQTYGTPGSSTPAGGTAFQSAINQGIADLKQGENWGTVWGRIHSQFPSIDATQIDSGLGTQWREPGAYQAYKANQTGTGTTSEVSKAKQLIIQNGGSTDDQNRVETDANFRAWVLANY